MKKINYIKAEIGCGAGIRGCEKAPHILAKKNKHIEKNVVKTITADGKYQKLEALPNLKKFCEELADAVYETLNVGHFPIIIGGDHRGAIGTWSGVSKYLNDENLKNNKNLKNSDLGLIWVDAHFDLHTPAS
jgi:arginase family enzyme